MRGPGQPGRVEAGSALDENQPERPLAVLPLDPQARRGVEPLLPRPKALPGTGGLISLSRAFGSKTRIAASSIDRPLPRTTSRTKAMSMSARGVVRLASPISRKCRKGWGWVARQSGFCATYQAGVELGRGRGRAGRRPREIVVEQGAVPAVQAGALTIEARVEKTVRTIAPLLADEGVVQRRDRGGRSVPNRRRAYARDQNARRPRGEARRAMATGRLRPAPAGARPAPLRPSLQKCARTRRAAPSPLPPSSRPGRGRRGS